MSAYTSLTRVALVRWGYSEEQVWRDALGPQALRCCATDGPIDAPTWIPTGSTAGDPPCPVMTHRDDS